MWLPLVFAGLVLVIAYLQSTQGLFSALLMTVLTLCCCGAAFGTYEWVAVNWLAGLWRPDYAHPIALATIFGIPLLGLRLGLDHLVQRSAILPIWIDRAGAATCGLVTGMVMVGVATFSFLMIPFGPSVMGFARVDVAVQDDGNKNATPPDPKTVEHDLFLKPDRFAVGVASMLSEGVFSGSTNFRDAHPDLVRSSGWLNAVPSEVSRYAPPGSISVVRTESVPFVYRRIPSAQILSRQRGQREQPKQAPPTFEPIPPEGGLAFHVIRVALKRTALDTRKSHLFTLRQFQLVGRENGEEVYKRYHPIAIQQDNEPSLQGTINRHIRFHRVGKVDWPVIDTVYTTREGNNAEVEVVFELPIGFQPAFIQYKRSARADVSFGGATPAQADTGASAPKVAPDAQPTSASTSADAPRGGGVRRFASRSGKSMFGDALPETLKAYRKLKNARISRGALVEGHLVAYADEQDKGKDVTVKRFKVPRDKQLLQLNTEFLKAHSTLGKALAFAVGTLQNFFVEDDKGNRYELIGKYAIAQVKGREVIEIQYFANKAGSIGQLGKFEKIRDDDLKGDYEYALLFLVEPGVRIVSFSTGGSASRKDDLTDQNLVAPN